MYFSTTLILLLTVLDILVYYLQKLQEKDNGEQKNSASSSSLDKRCIHKEDHGERKDSLLLSSSLYRQCRVFSLAEIRLATNDFDDAFIIGKGGFGKVYKGKVDIGGGIDVAIKRLDCNSSQGKTEFHAEIEMLSKLQHSNIVSLLGYCETDMILVYEYMPNGSLGDHLHKKRTNGSNSSQLTWIQRLNICIGAARGLDYLHTGTGAQHRVIHRDVKSSNILLDENLASKIADFGLSKITPASQSGATTNVYTGQIVCTFGYLDAEYFSTHRLTRKSDVYAFGVVLLEVLCGRPALDFTLDEEQHSLAGWAKHCIKRGRVMNDRKKGDCDNGDVATAGRKGPDLEGTATCNFKLDRLIGQGGFGMVFKGWLDTVTYTPQKAGKGFPVAIKKLNSESMQGLVEWQTEVNLLGKFSHPNVVKLLGYCQENMELLSVYEFMQRGSLENHLFRKRVEALPWSTRIKIAIDVAHGIAYLHSTRNNVIFRDIKTSNILLDEDYNAKVSDFGIAKLGPSVGESHVTTRVMGTYGYAAPEYVATGRLYVKSDVYGFGVVMLEIITGLRALDTGRQVAKVNLVDWIPPFLNKKRIHKIMDPRLEKKYPAKAAHKAAELILSCLKPEPKSRPSMEEVVSCLQDINAMNSKIETKKVND